MDTFVLALLDVQAQAFNRPIFVPSVGVGIRMVSDEVNRHAADNVLFNHPQDFRLFELGVWDEKTGLFTCHAQPKLVADCSAMKA